jgi:hypothetical protein
MAFGRGGIGSKERRRALEDSGKVRRIGATAHAWT